MTRLTPSFREKVWGSTHLAPLYPNSASKIGEVWFEGIPNLPLLVKFLFTTEKLSVQVHPNDEYARIHHDCRGKTEMWHVLAAEPGAKIAAGFRQALSPVQVREAALSGEIEGLLQWFDAAPGDTFFIPAGTVHAIGAGLALCEIQQHSDVTYRLYDYGRPRELHLDQALAVSDFGPYPARQQPRGNLLASCEYFEVERLSVNGSVHHTPPSGRFELLIAIEGSGELIRAGEVWYIEPGASAFDLTGNLTLLSVFRP